jgi:hypothetical protein
MRNLFGLLCLLLAASGCSVANADPPAADMTGATLCQCPPAPKVPHLVTPDGTDLGVMTGPTAAIHPTLGFEIDYGPPLFLYFQSADCTGTPYVDSPLRAARRWRSVANTMYVLTSNAPVTITYKSIIQRASCIDESAQPEMLNAHPAMDTGTQLPTIATIDLVAALR